MKNAIRVTIIDLILTLKQITNTKTKVMKNVILILLCLASLSITAQDKKKDWKSGKMGMPMMTNGIGVTFVNFDALNSRIASFPQYKPLKNSLFTISAGSMHEMHNFISQMTVTAGSTLTGDPDKRSSAARMLGVGIDLGYDVIPAERVMVYPLVGIGFEKYHAVFYKDVSAVDFDDVAASPSVQNSIRPVKFKNSFMTYRLGLGIAFKSPKNSNSIGIQAGYVGGFKDRSWNSNDDQLLTGAPVDQLHRFGVSLVLTGGMMGMHCK